MIKHKVNWKKNIFVEYFGNVVCLFHISKAHAFCQRVENKNKEKYATSRFTLTDQLLYAYIFIVRIF